MRIAIAGATGRIGSLTVRTLERDGHEVVRISRSLGVDLLTGEGLDAALVGVDALIDTTNTPAMERSSAVEQLGTMTRNLLAAEERAGVRHHVLLSIVGIQRIDGNAHYAGKREQERLVAEGPIPWTVVPATQFHDFAEMVAGWTERDGQATIAPLLVRPVAPADVAEVLAEVATDRPQGRYADLAGPDTQDLVDMARRTHRVRGREVRLVPTWSGVFGTDMGGEALLPGENARIAPTTFEQWLNEQAAAR
ncbi:SDR family oxidoreductase [Streptomyces triticirhizae]|uniref:NmrA family transcriptional regulator n=1 Tax=Streptomyces triticirhizae TaxID=2483353 RepID=A0A3M2MD91_9ACTN|nr:NAD(P)H-binding protein [Streptomyces triticirhizae]RMI45158.1 NmrA family transcriptional regulator [Streptomyces triticirhizae]